MAARPDTVDNANARWPFELIRDAKVWFKVDQFGGTIKQWFYYVKWGNGWPAKHDGYQPMSSFADPSDLENFWKEVLDPSIRSRLDELDPGFIVKRKDAARRGRPRKSQNNLQPGAPSRSDAAQSSCLSSLSPFSPAKSAVSDRTLVPSPAVMSLEKPEQSIGQPGAPSGPEYRGLMTRSRRALSSPSTPSPSQRVFPMPRSPKTPSKRKHMKTSNNSVPVDQTHQRVSTSLQLPEENLPTAVNGEKLFRFNAMTIPFSVQPKWEPRVEDLRTEAAKQWRWARSPSQAPCPPGTQTEEMDVFGTITGSGSPHLGEQVQSQTQMQAEFNWVVPGSPMQESGWGVTQFFQSRSPVQQSGWGAPELESSPPKPEPAETPWNNTWDPTNSGIFENATSSVFDPDPRPIASSLIYVDPVSSDSDAEGGEVSKFPLDESYADRKPGTPDHDDSKREVVPSSETEESDEEVKYHPAPAPKASNTNPPYCSGPEPAGEASTHSPTPGASGSQTTHHSNVPATRHQRQRSPTPESIHQLNSRQENEYILRHLLRIHNAAPPAKLILMGEEELVEACRTHGIEVPMPHSATAIAFGG